MTRAERPATVVVTDTNTPQGLTVARSLGRAGWRVIGASSTEVSPRARSRHVSTTITNPDPEIDGVGAGVALRSAAQEHQADLLFPTTDKSLLAVLDGAEEELSTPLASSSRPALEAAWNKSTTLDIAVDLGVPTPDSELVHSIDEALETAERFGFPVVAKPLRSHRWDQSGGIETCAVSVVADAASVRSLLADGDALPILIQRYVEGYGTGIELLADEGRIVAAFQHRRLHEVPVTGGMSSWRRAEVPDPDLLEFSRRLMSELAWTGLAMVEFRMTPAGPVLMEINGRVWGSIALPVHSGLDFPLLAGLVHLQRPVPERIDFTPGVEVRNAELEVRWLGSVLKAAVSPGRHAPVGLGDVAKTIGALLDPRTAFDVYQRDDPRPALAEVQRTLRGLFPARSWSGGAVAARPSD